MCMSARLFDKGRDDTEIERDVRVYALGLANVAVVNAERARNRSVNMLRTGDGQEVDARTA